MLKTPSLYLLYLLEKRKAPAYRRQAEDEPAGRLFFNLLDGLTEKWRQLSWDEGVSRTLKKALFAFFQWAAYDSSPKEPELDTLLTSSRWRLELDISQRLILYFPIKKTGS
jgi:hypothetical protein